MSNHIGTLSIKGLEVGEDLNRDGCQGGLASLTYNFLDNRIYGSRTD